MTAQPLGNVIERARLNEYAQNEKAIADRLPRHGRSPLSDGDRALIAQFVNWCDGQKVRHVPASPAVVATFVREFNWRGPKILLPMLRAIEALHDLYATLANPCATETVRAAVAEMFNDDLADLVVIPKDAPRSWPKNERILFAALPKEIQAGIVRRELEQRAIISRNFNEVADLRKELQRLKDGADTKPVELLQEKETQNG